MKTRKKSKKSSIIAEGALSLPNFDEIVKTNPRYQYLLLQALNYANYTFDMQFQKEQVKDYAKEHMDLDVTKVPEYELCHIGNICWLFKNGVDDINMEPYHDRIIDLCQNYCLDKDNNTKKRTTNTDKVNYIISQLEGMIDDLFTSQKNPIVPIDLFRNIGTFSPDSVRNYFQAILDDIDNNPDDYVDSDKNFIKYTKAAISLIFNHLDVYQEELEEKSVRRTKRKARKKKIIPSKMVKKLNYKKEDKEYNLKSKAPEEIVGANVLWLFNCKNRVLTQYVASDEVGLMVKGSTILNWCINTSKQKKLKVKEVSVILKELETCGKVPQRTLLDKCKSMEKSPNGRSNKNHIIYRVFK